MSSEVRDASHRITLDFHVGGQHLTDQRRQAAELYYQDLVFRYNTVVSIPKFTTELSEGLVMFIGRTIDREIAERSTRSSLNFDVGAIEKEQYGRERISVNFRHIYGERG